MTQMTDYTNDRLDGVPLHKSPAYTAV